MGAKESILEIRWLYKAITYMQTEEFSELEIELRQFHLFSAKGIMWIGKILDYTNSLDSYASNKKTA